MLCTCAGLQEMAYTLYHLRALYTPQQRLKIVPAARGHTEHMPLTEAWSGQAPTQAWQR